MHNPGDEATCFKSLVHGHSANSPLQGYIYIYIYATPPPPGTQVWAWFRCALTAEASRKNSSDLHTGRPEVCLIEERRLGRDPCLVSMALHTKFNSHIFPHKPCLLSKALPQKIPIISSQHMSFYMSSFNETKSAYVKELPRKWNPV